MTNVKVSRRGADKRAAPQSKEWTLFFPADIRRPGSRHGFAAGVALMACLFALALGAATAHGGELTPSLRAKVAEPAAADATIPVIVTLTDQVDASNYSGRRVALIAAMKRTAAATQPDVIGQLDGDVTRYWLINAVAVDATRDEIAALEADPQVAAVDYDRPVRIADAGPSMNSLTTFPDAGEGDWGLGTSRTPAAWRRFGVTGAGVTVGSIDTGVDPSSPELAGKIVAFRDFINGRPDAYDDNGHGTHTIGTMVGGARGGAPIGVAPGARVLVAKAAGAKGVGPGSALLAAAQWMSDPDGNPATADQPVVVNNSWTAPDANDPWFRDMIRNWLSLGIVPVFATGNNGPGPGSVGSPAGYPEVLAVGASAEDGRLSDFTARGPVNWLNLDGTGPAAGTQIIKPDIVAPGVNITSSVRDGYMSSTGTSMAAPHVSGAVALIAQANPGVRGAAAIELLKRTRTDLGAPGPDPVYGGGQLNVEAAVAGAVGAPATLRKVQTRVLRATRGRVVSGKRVTFVVRVAGASKYRWRVNRRGWSRPTSAARPRLRLAAGRQLVEVQGVDPVAGVDATPPRAVGRVLRALPRNVEFARARR